MSLDPEWQSRLGEKDGKKRLEALSEVHAFVSSADKKKLPSYEARAIATELAAAVPKEKNAKAVVKLYESLAILLRLLDRSAALQQSEELLAPLLAALGDSKQEVRRAAADLVDVAVSKAGPRDFWQLLRGLEQPWHDTKNWHVRAQLLAAAERHATQYGCGWLAATDVVLSAALSLSDRQQELREVAASCLQTLQSRDAPLLERLLHAAKLPLDAKTRVLARLGVALPGVPVLQADQQGEAPQHHTPSQDAAPEPRVPPSARKASRPAPPQAPSVDSQSEANGVGSSTGSASARQNEPHQQQQQPQSARGPSRSISLMPSARAAAAARLQTPRQNEPTSPPESPRAPHPHPGGATLVPRRLHPATSSAAGSGTQPGSPRDQSAFLEPPELPTHNSATQIANRTPARPARPSQPASASQQRWQSAQPGGAVLPSAPTTVKKKRERIGLAADGEFALISLQPPLNGLSERELQKEMDKASRELGDPKAAGDWQGRLATLQRLQAIAAGDSRRLANYVPCANKLRDALLLQCTELRSNVVRELCCALSLLAASMRDDFESLGEALLPPLLKGTAVTITVVSESCNAALQGVLRACPSQRLFKTLAEEYRKSKAPPVRLRCVDGLAVLLRCWPDALLSRCGDALQEVVRRALGDADGEVRGAARVAFAGLEQRLCERARQLFRGLEEGEQRYVNDRRQESAARFFALSADPSRVTSPQPSPACPAVGLLDFSSVDIMASQEGKAPSAHTHEDGMADVSSSLLLRSSVTSPPTGGASLSETPRPTAGQLSAPPLAGTGDLQTSRLSRRSLLEGVNRRVKEAATHARPRTPPDSPQSTAAHPAAPLPQRPPQQLVVQHAATEVSWATAPASSCGDTRRPTVDSAPPSAAPSPSNAAGVPITVQLAAAGTGCCDSPPKATQAQDQTDEKPVMTQSGAVGKTGGVYVPPLPLQSDVVLTVALAAAPHRTEPPQAVVPDAKHHQQAGGMVGGLQSPRTQPLLLSVSPRQHRHPSGQDPPLPGGTPGPSRIPLPRSSSVAARAAHAAMQQQQSLQAQRVAPPALATSVDLERACRVPHVSASEGSRLCGLLLEEAVTRRNEVVADPPRLALALRACFALSSHPDERVRGEASQAVRCLAIFPPPLVLHDALLSCLAAHTPQSIPVAAHTLAMLKESLWSGERCMQMLRGMDPPRQLLLLKTDLEAIAAAISPPPGRPECSLARHAAWDLLPCVFAAASLLPSGAGPSSGSLRDVLKEPGLLNEAARWLLLGHGPCPPGVTAPTVTASECGSVGGTMPHSPDTIRDAPAAAESYVPPACPMLPAAPLQQQQGAAESATKAAHTGAPAKDARASQQPQTNAPAAPGAKAQAPGAPAALGAKAPTNAANTLASRLTNSRALEARRPYQQPHSHQQQQQGMKRGGPAASNATLATARSLGRSSATSALRSVSNAPSHASRASSRAATPLVVGDRHASRQQSRASSAMSSRGSQSTAVHMSATLQHNAPQQQQQDLTATQDPRRATRQHHRPANTLNARRVAEPSVGPSTQAAHPVRQGPLLAAAPTSSASATSGAPQRTAATKARSESRAKSRQPERPAMVPSAAPSRDPFLCSEGVERMVTAIHTVPLVRNPPATAQPASRHAAPKRRTPSVQPQRSVVSDQPPAQTEEVARPAHGAAAARSHIRPPSVLRGKEAHEQPANTNTTAPPSRIPLRSASALTARRGETPLRRPGASETPTSRAGPLAARLAVPHQQQQQVVSVAVPPVITAGLLSASGVPPAEPSPALAPQPQATAPAQVARPVSRAVSSVATLSTADSAAAPQRTLGARQEAPAADPAATGSRRPSATPSAVQMVGVAPSFAPAPRVAESVPQPQALAAAVSCATPPSSPRAKTRYAAPAPQQPAPQQQQAPIAPAPQQAPAASMPAPQPPQPPQQQAAPQQVQQSPAWPYGAVPAALMHTHHTQHAQQQQVSPALRAAPPASFAPPVAHQQFAPPTAYRHMPGGHPLLPPQHQAMHLPPHMLPPQQYAHTHTHQQYVFLPPHAHMQVGATVQVGAQQHVVFRPSAVPHRG